MKVQQIRFDILLHELISVTLTLLTLYSRDEGLPTQNYSCFVPKGVYIGILTGLICVFIYIYVYSYMCYYSQQICKPLV